MKILHVDTETTGVDRKQNAVIQIAGAIEIDGDIKEYFDIKVRPFPGAVIEQGAIDTHGITEEEMMSYQTHQQAYAQFTGILGKYIKKFDRTDKFTPSGYNSRFDVDFLAELAVRSGDKYFGSWQNWRIVDHLATVYWLRSLGIIPELKNYKLETVCEYFGIDIEGAHDAIVDIKATIEVGKRLNDLITFGSSGE